MSKRKSGLPFVLIANIVESKTVDLSRWKIKPLPIEPDRLQDANHSENNWQFLIEDNQLLIVQDNSREKSQNLLPFSDEFTAKNQRLFSGKRHVKKVKSGFLVGLNHGEFGGGLVFVSDDESVVYNFGERLRIREFFELNSKIYAIEGLSHLGSSGGQIIEIYKDDIWTYKTAVKLDETPSLIEKLEDYFIILTNRNLIKLTKNLEIKKILTAPIDWQVLYPTSVYIDAENLFVAMREGILKIENFQTNSTFSWFVPK